nr:hypothetical protein JVH1_9165 [Rhodococcus sp. JVH1]
MAITLLRVPRHLADEGLPTVASPAERALHHLAGPTHDEPANEHRTTQ